jgi:signal transduction histidine kinase
VVLANAPLAAALGVTAGVDLRAAPEPLGRLGAYVARHAHATEAGVLVEERGDRLVAEVADNGIGGADPAAGWSLRALADRVAAVGRRLDVRSPRGEGTVVRAELPTGR